MTNAIKLPDYALFGERAIFPDVLHVEAIVDRAAQHGWRIASHRHPGLLQVLYVKAGEATLHLAHGSETLTPPVVIVLPPNAVHGFTFAAGTVGVVVSIPTTLLDDSALQVDRVQQRAATARITGLIAILQDRHADADGPRDPSLRALAAALIWECAEATPAAGNTADLFTRFEVALRNHATQGWEVGDYARSLGASASSLNRVVRARAQMSVMGAVMAYRLELACKRLAYTRQPITVIAYDLGFSDPTHFARAFRKGIGCTPRAYRKRFEG
ncbi:AraC family transcriptional regulator, transcriptional activator of pobA [Loktanella sp. DSM 29012]|uniref:helix-turn-helix domain-containing protein n=1 Tax=Loktanella sp. DSM 29012 TaxID=1881056 RepID=UPI0008B2F375|nr:helix-turn-helix domain-containing protein [Loktanella sp. DSM 29012]SEQ47150.1 AraC family transcriptional regulator, transcriptional activator of pobA [Loktanella sp. DSM 29012]